LSWLLVAKEPREMLLAVATDIFVENNTLKAVREIFRARVSARVLLGRFQR